MSEVGNNYDLLVIGGGSAGLVAAGFAAKLGASVAIVEKGLLGGDCTWTGCVPSKALLKATRVARQSREGHRYGLPASDQPIDLGRVMDWVHSVVAEIAADETPEKLAAEGIDIITGAGRFVDRHTLEVDGRRISAGKIVIATGARPVLPNVAGLADVECLTYLDIWDIRELPERLAIIGCGPVGSEFAQAFARLGSHVTQVEFADRMLPQEDPDISTLMTAAFGAEGIEQLFDARVSRMWRDGEGIHLQVDERDLVCDRLLYASGRRPVVDGMGLEAAGVDFDRSGIGVDDRMRTSQKHIYAVGDCNGSPQFTYYAGWQGAMAARNAILPGTDPGIVELVPRVTFTDPEVASVGLSEAEARARYGDIVVSKRPMSRVDRAVIEGTGDGVVKVVHRRDGTIVGVTIVAPPAGEMIHEWIVAMEAGQKLGDMAQVLHAYPTYSLGAQQLAAEVRLTGALSGMSGMLARRLSKVVRQK